MKLNEYQELSKRTMPYNGEPANQVEFENMLGNYAMGLVGESLEMQVAMSNQVMYADEGNYKDSEIWAKKAFSEIGDTLHYAVGLLSCLNETLDISKIKEGNKGGLYIAGDICEIAKKHIYHRHELDREELILKVYEYIGENVSSLEDYMDEILQMNIDKLKTRYPEKFSVEDSIKRVDTHEH